MEPIVWFLVILIIIVVVIWIFRPKYSTPDPPSPSSSSSISPTNQTQEPVFNLIAKPSIPGTCYTGQFIGSVYEDGRFDYILVAFGFSSSRYAVATLTGVCGGIALMTLGESAIINQTAVFKGTIYFPLGQLQSGITSVDIFASEVVPLFKSFCAPLGVYTSPIPDFALFPSSLPAGQFSSRIINGKCQVGQLSGNLTPDGKFNYTVIAINLPANTVGAIFFRM